MNVVSFASILLFALAALVAALAVASLRPSLVLPARILGGLGALGQIPALLASGERARALVCVGVSLLAPGPLPYLVAATIALLSTLDEGGRNGLPVLIAGCAAIVALRSVTSAVEAKLAAQKRREWVGASVALLAAVAILLVDRGGVLHWRVGIGGPPLPGVAVLLGVSFLCCLGSGFLFVASSFGEDVELGTISARRVLIIGAAFLGLAAGLASYLRSSVPPGLDAGRSLVLLWGAFGILVLGILALLGADTSPSGADGEKELLVALLLALVALAWGGVESFFRTGVSMSGVVPALVAAVLLGFGASGGASLTLARRTAFALGLLYLLVGRA